MNERLIKLVNDGLMLLGGSSEMSMDDVKILRAFLAQGFYDFSDKNKNRTSKKPDYDWMLNQAQKMGVNQ